MARKDALLMLHHRLQARRSELLRIIADEIGGLGQREGSGRDDIDIASDSAQAEMISQLAQMEYRELKQIERALIKLRHGSYGSCELCGRKIPVARLNALPFTALCIGCQRDVESNPDRGLDLNTSDWQKLCDAESAASEVRVDMSDIADIEYNVG